jgi:hypothetical protein
MLPSTNSPRPPLSRREMKAVLLWAARQLASESGEVVYTGPVRVRVEKVGGAEAIEVRPAKGVDGMELPESVGVARSDTAADPVADPDELLRVMFSRDELNILSQLVAESKATVRRAKSVQEATKIPEGKFWVLWSNLQQRGVVVDATEGEGFEIGPAWVAEWVRKREGVAAA